MQRCRLVLVIALVVGSGACKRSPPTGAILVFEVDVAVGLAERAAVGQPLPDGGGEAVMAELRQSFEKRLASMGHPESTVRELAGSRVRVQLPQRADVARARFVLTKRAKLELTPVDTVGASFLEHLALPVDDSVLRQRETFASGRSTDVYLTAADAAPMRALVAGAVPKGRRLLFGPQDTSRGTAVRSYLLGARPGLSGLHLTDARVVEDPNVPGTYHVQVRFDERGAHIFEQLTAAHVGERLAIVFDDIVISAPLVMERIPGGSVRITLRQDGDPRARFAKARDLVLALKAGALPAPVHLVSEE